jgi:hypothetical protein
VRLLAVVNEPVNAELLQSVAGSLPRDAEVLVVAPASTDYREDGGLAMTVRERFGVPVDVGLVQR